MSKYIGTGREVKLKFFHDDDRMVVTVQTKNPCPQNSIGQQFVQKKIRGGIYSPPFSNEDLGDLLINLGQSIKEEWRVIGE